MPGENIDFSFPAFYIPGMIEKMPVITEADWAFARYRGFSCTFDAMQKLVTVSGAAADVFTSSTPQRFLVLTEVDAPTSAVLSVRRFAVGEPLPNEESIQMVYKTFREQRAHAHP